MNMTTTDKPLKKQIERRLLADLQPHPLLSDIQLDPDSSHFKQWQADLADNGQTNIIEITPDGDVIGGLQWFLAAQELEYDHVRVWVRSDLSDEEAAIRALESTYNNLPLSGLAKARTLVALRDRQKAKDFREAYGPESVRRPLLRNREALRKVLKELHPEKSERSLDRYACVLNTPVEVQDAVDRGELKLAVAGRVSKRGDKLQKEIARRLRAGEEPAAVVEELAPVRERYKPPGRKIGRVYRAWEDGVDELEPDFDRIKSCLSSDDLPQLLKVHKFVGELIRHIEQHPEECCSREQKLLKAVDEIRKLQANPESAIPTTSVA